ncbi:MAG: PAS domain S-box protein [Halobacteriales archaeon]|nr:PAS domain S-box protein [Halobacteriales archaeon]
MPRNDPRTTPLGFERAVGRDGSDAAIHVLHVEDEPDIAKLTASYLERTDERFTVETAPTAEEGLAALGEAEYDCIVSDFEMPGIDGIEFLEVVRERHADLPFILFTGKGSEEIASDAISAGVTDYLQKGVGTSQYEVLANRIENAVEHWWTKRSEDEIRSRLMAITENSNDVILTIDARSTIEYVNAAVEDLLGYDRDDLVGDSLTRLMPPRLHEDHLNGVSRYLETGERTMDWRNAQFTALDAEGNEIPVSISFGEFDQDGERRFVGIVRDVSERVRLEEELRGSEQLFRQLAENIPEVVWMSDPEKEEIFYVSPMYEEIWQRPVESLYDDATSFLDAIHEDDRDRVRDALEEQSTGDYEEEYRIVLPDGRMRWIHDRAVPVTDEDGEVRRIVGIATDITHRKR